MTENPNWAGGILLVDKPEGITSQAAVNAVRRAYGTRQAGHTGTLDPMATGLLVVLVGRAVKASEYAVCDRKSYEAVLRLGLSTDTEDITGKVLSESGDIPGAEAVKAACARFTGKTTQVPPMYSALKVGGKKLYELAREGKTVDRAAREITVYSLFCEPLSQTDYRLRIECSAGTYIRSLCRDIGAVRGCGGTMAALRRTTVGKFDVKDAVSVEELRHIAEARREEPQIAAPDAPIPEAFEAGLPASLVSRLLPLEGLFSSLPAVTLGAFFEKLYRSGCAVSLAKLGLSGTAEGARIRVADARGNFFSLGETVPTEDGPALKSLKLFSL